MKSVGLEKSVILLFAQSADAEFNRTLTTLVLSLLCLCSLQRAIPTSNNDSTPISSSHLVQVLGISDGAHQDIIDEQDDTMIDNYHDETRAEGVEDEFNGRKGVGEKTRLVEFNVWCALLTINLIVAKIPLRHVPVNQYMSLNQ